jgi:hypothetical protein
VVVLAWVGSAFIVAVAIAAAYDYRVARRGAVAGPTALVRKRLGSAGTTPYVPGHLGPWRGDKNRGQGTPPSGSGMVWHRRWCGAAALPRRRARPS